MVIFDQIEIRNNLFLRHFNHSLTQNELKWHKDNDNRLIYSLLPTNWCIQLDNEFPIRITQDPIFITMHVFHRLISDNKKDLFLYVKRI